MVTRFHAGNTFAYFLNNARALVAQYGWEVALRVGTGQRKGVCVTHAGGGHFHQHFSRLRAFNINLNQLKRLTRF